MARPKRCRRIASLPNVAYFKPADVPSRALHTVALTVDEFEALRLADYAGLYHEQAAKRMDVSRQTFGRIVESGRKKVARALVEGLALRIEGGDVELTDVRALTCADCGHFVEATPETGHPAACPASQGDPLQETTEPEARGAAGRRAGRRGGAQHRR